MTVAIAVSPVNSLVLHSACIGGVNAPRFNDFLAQTRQDLDPDEGLSSFTTEHQNIEIPPFPRAVNTELGMLPAYSPFLNIEEQTIGSLKAENSRNCFKPFFQFVYGLVVRKMTKLVAHMLKNTFTPFV